MGCWKDNYETTLQENLEGSHQQLNDDHTKRSLSISKCSLVSAAKNLHFFALKEGGMCLGIQGSVRDSFQNKGKSTDCANGKGGYGSLDVYLIHCKIFLALISPY